MLEYHSDFKRFQHSLVLVSLALRTAFRPSSYGPINNSSNESQNSKPELDANRRVIANYKHLSTLGTGLYGYVDLTHDFSIALFYKNKVPTLAGVWNRAHVLLEALTVALMPIAVLKWDPTTHHANQPAYHERFKKAIS